MGFKKYENAKIFRSTVEELFTKEFLEQYLHDLHINFTSSEGRAESYNMFHRGGKKQAFFEKFVSANTKTGGHFHRRRSESCEESLVEDKDEEKEGDGEGGECEDTEEGGKENCPEISTMHLLGRKNLSSGFYNHELICELDERNMLKDSIFGPKQDPEDPSKTICYKESLRSMMKDIESKRRNELYTHKAEDCDEKCQSRGCSQVREGFKKLNFKMAFAIRRRPPPPHPPPS